MTDGTEQGVPPSAGGPAVSIVVPFYNEAQNAGPCYRDVVAAMEEEGLSFEAVLVDDGSTDGTLEELRRAAEGDARVTILELRRNYGQAAAFEAGFDRARAPIVVPMDGDLQNDPRDIRRLLAKLDELPGYDVVTGWRRDRRDPMSRTVPSRLANWLISLLTGVHLHDYGCSLKACRRDVLRDVRLYGEMHRFIPALAHWAGGRVAELPVNHRPRPAGRSKYGLGRTVRVLLDLATVRFIMRYLTKPLYFFGKLGLAGFVAAFLVLGVVVLEKVTRGADMTGNPLLYLSVTLLIVGVQFMLMGLIMEVLTRTYYESQGRRPYAIRRVYRGGQSLGPDAPGERR